MGRRRSMAGIAGILKEKVDDRSKSERTIYIAKTNSHALRHGNWKLVGE